MNKKHLIASAFCGCAFALAFLASCADKDCYDEDKAAIYRQAKYASEFKRAFGEVDPEQDWGFGTTRATRGVNANANQWFTGEGGATPVYEVDPNVTDAERNAVFAYVNRDKGNLTLASQPNWTDYFVTQVWKGDDNELDGVKTPQSTSYPDQNGQTTTIDGASHMDQLETQLANGTWEHIYNFNNANNGNTVTNVNNNHIVEKMLMVNSGTTKFRYNNSQSSFQSEKYIVVKGSDIPNMPAECADYYYVCFDFENGYTATEAANETTHATLSGSYEKKVVKTVTEKQKESKDVTYETNVEFVVEYGNMNLQSDSEITSDMRDAACAQQHRWINSTGWNDGRGGTYDYSGVTGTIDHVDNSNPWYIVSYVKYSGTITRTLTEEIEGEEVTTTVEEWETVTFDNENFSVSGVYTAETLTADKVLELKGETAEVKNVNITVTVKGYGTGDKHFDGDNNYTDWIVRISPAKVKPAAVTARYRVFAEDLGAGVSDWDFNDVVFDVVQWNNGKTDIILQAAGGTLTSVLKFNVDGQDAPEELNIHSLFGVEQNQMVNTRVNTLSREPVKKTYNCIIQPADIDIVITYQGGDRQSIRSEKGQAAGKFCIDCTGITWVDWMDEYVNITTVHSDFGNWVNDAKTIWWDTTPVEEEEEEEQIPEEEEQEEDLNQGGNEPNTPNVDPQEPETPSGDYGVKYAGAVSGNFTIDHATYLSNAKTKITVTFVLENGGDINGNFRDADDEWNNDKMMRWEKYGLPANSVETFVITASDPLFGKNIGWWSFGSQVTEVYIKCE